MFLDDAVVRTERPILPSLCAAHTRQFVDAIAFQGLHAFEAGTGNLEVAFQSIPNALVGKAEKLLRESLGHYLPGSRPHDCPVCEIIESCECGERKTCCATTMVAHAVQSLAEDHPRPFHICTGHWTRMTQALVDRGMLPLIKTRAEFGTPKYEPFCALQHVVTVAGYAALAHMGMLRAFNYGCPLCRVAFECRCDEGAGCPSKRVHEVVADEAVREAVKLGLVSQA